MRTTLNVVAAFALAAAAIADEPKNTNRSAPTAPEIIDLDGCRLLRVFAKCGIPDDVFPSTDSRKNPIVVLQYDGFGFEIRDKAVISCFFLAPWSVPVLNCKLGDTPEEVVKKLGQPAATVNKDDVQSMAWAFKDRVQQLQINFKNNKCSKIAVSLL